MKTRLMTALIGLMFAGAVAAEVEFIGVTTTTTDGNITSNIPEAMGYAAATFYCQDELNDTDAFMCSIQDFASNANIAEFFGEPTTGWIMDWDNPINGSCQSFRSNSVSQLGITVSSNGFFSRECSGVNSVRRIACCKKVPDDVDIANQPILIEEAGDKTAK